MGKGSAPRTFDIDQETFAGNWAKTFGKQNAKQKQEDTDTSGESTHPENKGDELHSLRPDGSK
jgi:hypothetical protein